jgi:hypothetical protein
MAIKGFGIAVKLTFGGNNQFIYVSTYLFGIIVSLCIIVQMNYFNKALDTFSTNVCVCYLSLFSRYRRSHTELSRVNPLYYVCFSTATIVASLILFQGLNTDNPVNSISLLVGFIITFIGMHLLELSRKPAVTGHNALEHGILNPRLSLQGRASIDGWPAASTVTSSPGLHLGHARHSSRTALFDVLEDAPNGSAQELGLQSLREDVEDDELEAATERTRLRAEERRSRSHTASPTGSPDDPWRS